MSDIIDNTLERPMIIVTGATGSLGSQIVTHLLERVPAEEIGVSVRDPHKADHLAALGVRVRSGDFTDPASLQHAFEGAEQVLVVSAAIRGGGAFDANAAAIDAAVAAGASRVLYTGHQAAASDSLFSPQTVHAATQEHLALAGVPFVALSNGFYASSLDIHLDRALASGTISTPVDGPVSWTAHVDLAEAAVAVLLDPTVSGVTEPLTASDALDLADVAVILSDITGRRIVHEPMEDEAWKLAAIERGMPPMVAEFSLGMFLAARRGEFAVTSPALGTLIGRTPTPVRTVLQQLASVRG